MKICTGGEGTGSRAMVVAGSALSHCQLVTGWIGRRSQGSLQWFPLPQLSLFCFWGIARLWLQGNSSLLPIRMAKLPGEETRSLQTEGLAFPVKAKTA